MAPFKSNSSGLIGSFVSELEATETRRGAVATSPNPNTPGNGYIYHIFTAPGTFTVTTSGYIDLLLVGGGGGGGKGNPSSYRGGGGGAGGFREEYNIFCPAQSYPITIGSGGNGTSSVGADGGQGAVTSFTSTNPFRLITTATSTSLSVGGGGGGGAYELGHSIAAASTGGAGGDGRVAFAGDTGIPTDYGESAPSEQFGGSGRCFAGGGGGAGNVSAGSGGVGGGGNGNGGNATTNTGSGGGGSAPPGSGGNGAPGIVIIRVKVNPT